MLSLHWTKLVEVSLWELASGLHATGCELTTFTSIAAGASAACRWSHQGLLLPVDLEASSLIEEGPVIYVLDNWRRIFFLIKSLVMTITPDEALFSALSCL